MTWNHTPPAQQFPTEPTVNRSDCSRYHSAVWNLKEALMADDNFEQVEYVSFFQDICRSLVAEAVRKKVYHA
jgi:hypothetical protein